MNLIVADRAGRVHVATSFREDPEYFQMHVAQTHEARIICSDPYPEPGPAARDDTTTVWTPLHNGTVMTF